VLVEILIGENVELDVISLLLTDEDWKDISDNYNTAAAWKNYYKTEEVSVFVQIHDEKDRFVLKVDTFIDAFEGLSDELYERAMDACSPFLKRSGLSIVKYIAEYGYGMRCEHPWFCEADLRSDVKVEVLANQLDSLAARFTRKCLLK